MFVYNGIVNVHIICRMGDTTEHETHVASGETGVKSIPDYRPSSVTHNFHHCVKLVSI